MNHEHYDMRQTPLSDRIKTRIFPHQFFITPLYFNLMMKTLQCWADFLLCPIGARNIEVCSIYDYNHIVLEITN